MKETIVSILEEETNGITATGIAKAMGKTKARAALKNALAELVDDGVVVCDGSGRYDMYSLPETEGASISNTSEIEVKSVPSITSKVINGYSVNPVVDGIEITTPSNQKVSLSSNEYLLVINDEPLYSVQSAKDVLDCISAFATSKGYATYVVSNVNTGKIIGTENDISLNEDRVLMIEIKRHNKAA